MNAVVFDLGLSSMQLESSGRGFSFRADEPLDMRFDPDSDKPTAAELSAAEKEANCLVRPSRKSSDLLAVIDDTMRDRQKGIAPNCPPPR